MNGPIQNIISSWGFPPASQAPVFDARSASLDPDFDNFFLWDIWRVQVYQIYTWWFIPRIVSGLVYPSYTWTLPPFIPFITRVVTHLLSKMSHQVCIYIYRERERNITEKIIEHTETSPRFGLATVYFCFFSGGSSLCNRTIYGAFSSSG